MSFASPDERDYKNLFSFDGEPDGSLPAGGLTLVGDIFYGATILGGDSGISGDGDGVIFEMTTAGAFTLLHTFGNSPDGSRPNGNLVLVNGTLYGTTQEGGTATSSEGSYLPYGTIFAMSPSGSLSILYSFKGGRGGAHPWHLTALNGTLYGTTFGGDDLVDKGTVFAVSGSEQVTVLHRFTGSDGAHPGAGLTVLNGTLYGTTSTGGANNSGTIFAMEPSGSVQVLHDFGTGNAGTSQADLTAFNDKLYGTTYDDGNGDCLRASAPGTAFELSPSGHFRVLYTFQGSPDGYAPFGPLLVVNGRLYGTTLFGGKHSRVNQCGGGTVYQLKRSGDERVLYSFKGGADGAGPYGA
jgi:uncharacterized repeat protein (TIGR03803 family)